MFGIGNCIILNLYIQGGGDIKLTTKNEWKRHNNAVNLKLFVKIIYRNKEK